jgi:hypothetical protein
MDGLSLSRSNRFVLFFAFGLYWLAGSAWADEPRYQKPIKVLVADFEAIDAAGPAVADPLLERVRQACQAQPYIELERLSASFAEKDGQEAARLKGLER